MTYYYFQVDGNNRPVANSNFSSAIPLNEPDLVPFLSYGNLGKIPVKYQYQDTWFVYLDEYNEPISNTIQYGNCECPNRQVVFIPLTCGGLSINKIYSGTFNNSPSITQSFIEASDFEKSLSFSDTTVAFNTTTPLIHWIAWPKDEYNFTGHYINELDHSSFGTTNTFSTPVLVGDYYFIQTNFPTQITRVTLR